MGHLINKLVVVVLSLSLTLSLFPNPTSAQLSTTFYAKTCPNVETLVRNAVKKKFDQTFVTVPATVRLFFHDCFVTVRIYIYLQFDTCIDHTHKTM